MSVSQAGKGARFRALHEEMTIFVMPNPWDVGSARVLAGLGFQALATSSCAAAAAMGRRDYRLGRDQALAHAASIVSATDLPVSADLENGFGDAPEDVAEAVRRAADAGLVGCTIEDSTGRPEQPLYEMTHAVERIAAGAEAARALPFPFLLTARAHNFLYPAPDLNDTIKRLQAYERAGADVLFAPCLPDLATVKHVCGALAKPFNYMATLKGSSYSIEDLADAGVTRISLATSLYRVAMNAVLEAAAEIRNTTRFDFVDRIAAMPDLYRLMGI